MDNIGSLLFISWAMISMKRSGFYFAMPGMPASPLYEWPLNC
jgi:hypothetical protein